MYNQNIIGLYIRTEKQNNLEVRKQEEKLLSRFNTENNLIYDLYIDNGYSSVSDKPEYNRMLQDMQQNKFNLLVAYSLDRFGRSYDAIESFMKQFNKCNCKLMTIEENLELISQYKVD